MITRIQANNAPVLPDFFILGFSLNYSVQQLHPLSAIAPVVGSNDESVAWSPEFQRERMTNCLVHESGFVYT